MRGLFGGGGGGGGAGVTLLSSRPLSASHGDVPSTARAAAGGGQGVVLLSSKSLNTGYEHKGNAFVPLRWGKSGLSFRQNV